MLTYLRQRVPKATNIGSSTYTFTDTSEPGHSIVDKRPQDISAVLDAVYGLPEEHSLSGRLSDDVVLAGHSFGGYTSFLLAGTGIRLGVFDLACERGDVPPEACDYWDATGRALHDAGFRDDRVDIVVPMTPTGAEAFGAGLAEIEIPTLLMTGAADATTTNAAEGDPIWNSLEGENKLRVDFPLAGHFSFTNVCELGVLADDGCGPGFTPSSEFHPVVNAYVMAFARHHLWGDEEVVPILDGTTELLPGTVVSAQ